MPPLRILLVDDSPDFLAFVARLLAACPWVDIVGHAHSGQEAREQALRLRPDLVVMDLTMPGMNGLEATRHIKAQPGAPCVVMLTLHDDPYYRTAARDAGADGFVRKPDVSIHLLPVIHGLFDAPARGAAACQA